MRPLVLERTHSSLSAPLYPVKEEPQPVHEAVKLPPQSVPSSSSSTVNLPAGWEAVDSAQGTYYCNRMTGKTSWNVPPEAQGVAQTAPKFDIHTGARL